MPPGSTSSPKESSKQRSLRIELLYLRRGNAWYRSKYAWSLVALLIAGGYVVWLGAGGDRAAAQLSPGPLASPHAALNTRCADCHTAYVSTSAGGDGVNWLSHKLLGADVQARTEVRDGEDVHVQAGDRKCIECHQREAKAHHKNQFPSDLKSCASCHADHRGDGVSLARPDDKACTICHEGIGLHRKDGKSEYDPPIDNVAFFGRAGEAKPNHPPFRSLPKTDDNNFKFNHQLHMLPGQWPRGGDLKDAWTPEKLLAEFRGKYGTVDVPVVDAADPAAKKVVTLVQLQCDSCHVPQEGDPAVQSGAYMLPIRYEQHCKACHSLDLRLLNTVDTKDPAAKPEPPLLVPHGLNKREIDEFLVGISAKLKNADSTRERFPERIPVRIPGKTPAEETPENTKTDPDAERVEEWRPKIQDVMCAKCHATETTAEAGSSDDLFKQAVGFAPPKLSERWLKHGQFDHRAHRAWADCTVCHVGTNAPETLQAKPLYDDHHVLIPQLEVCAKCHAPANPQIKNNSWARFDCAECHRYHAHPGAP